MTLKLILAPIFIEIVKIKCYNSPMILYFDTETTGLRPGNICQLSYITETREKTSAKNYFFAVDYVSPSAQAVHGFSKEKLEELSGGRRFYGFREEIHGIFREADLIVAHNLPFDLSFLMSEFEENDMCFSYKQGLCSMRHFTPVCKIARAGGKGYKYPKLSELAEFFGLYPYDTSMAAYKLFDCGANLHDARYDTAMLYMSIKNASQKDAGFKDYLEKYL